MTRRPLRLLGLVLVGALGLYVLADAAEDAFWNVLDAFGDASPDETASGTPDPREWDVVADLRGPWAFRIGDDPAWAAADAEAEGWERLTVPGAWEDAGFSGYDGFAWYRTTFTLDTAQARRAPAFLLLGRIDDADEVWLNGAYVGRSGGMPPLYRTAAFGSRAYLVPPDLLVAGENVVAVRVFDEGLEGGILEGPVALAVPTARGSEVWTRGRPDRDAPVQEPSPPPPVPPPPPAPRPAPPAGPVVADLSGTWRFRLGDDRTWAQPGADDAGWDRVRVPDIWDVQGYGGYDGYAWYRTTVTLTAAQAGYDLVLVLGAVDDLDEAFVNGVRVGATGAVDRGRIDGDEWLVERAYPVPGRVLRAGRNVVAVRVFDALDKGGIYHGPVALMTPKGYIESRKGAW